MTMMLPRNLFIVAIACCLFGASSRSFAATVTYVMQDGNFPTQSNNGGDFFNQGSTELGMWANSGSKQTVAWRTFRTDGSGGGSARNLQVGDIFKITVSATRAFGQIGFSLNAGGNTSSYNDRNSGSRLFFNTDNYGQWYVNRSGGNEALGAGYAPIQNTYKDYIFTIRITSETTADVFMTVDGVDYREYNSVMNGSAGTNISAFSIYGSDMWDGDSNDNAYWKQNTSVEDTGRVELGYYLGSTSTFTPGKVVDGLVANSTTSSRANEVFIGGDSGSAVILNQANTYTGLTTVNANATARAQNASAFGTTGGGVTVSSGGMVEISGTTAIGAEALTLNGTGVSNAGALRNTSGNNSWGGLITLASASRINSDSGTLTLDVSSGDAITGTHNLTFGGAGNVTVSDAIATSSGTVTKDGAGTLTLSGNNTHSGETLLNNGTILVGNNGAFGTGTMTINYDAGTGTRTLASSSGSGFTLNNNFNLYFNSFTLGQTSGGTGSLILGGAGKTFVLGNDNTTQNRVITVNGNHEIAAAVTGGNNNHLVKQGSGELALSGENTSTGNIYIDSGTIHLKGGSLGGGSIDIGGGAANNAVNSENATLKVTSGSFSRSVIINSETTSGGTSGTRNINFANSTGTSTLSGTVALEKTAEVSVASGGTGLLSGVISGAGGLTKTDSGTLEVSNANTFDGNVAINGGKIKMSHATALGDTGTISVGAGADLEVSGGITVARNLTLSAKSGEIRGGRLMSSGASKNTYSGTVAVNNSEFDVASGNTLDVTGKISGTGTVTKTGAGELQLSNTGNDYSGITDVQNGTLTASSIANSSTASTIGTGSEVKLGSSANAGTFKYTGGTAGMNRTVTVGSAGGTINVNDSAATMTLNGTVAGSGNTLTKTGAGTLAFGSGGSVSLGTIAVQQGTLLLGAANQLGATTNAASSLDLSAGTTLKTASDLAGNVLTLAGTSAQADTIFDFDTASGNDFTFGSTTWYGGSLKLSNVAVGTVVNFGQFSGNSGLTFNDFQSKVSFSNTGLQAQINFSGTSLTVAAIPEPKVYMAAGVLALMIGVVEVRRRRKTAGSKA